MTITLTGEPRSTNQIYRHACQYGRLMSYMSPEGRALKEEYQWQARSQWRGKPLLGPVLLEITLYLGTKRKADWDNFHKISMDALSGIVYEDDSQITDATVHRRYDKDNPRIEITVTAG